MFSVSEYFDRMEKVSLEILETMEPIDKTITLWWGFDGIRLSEDGTSKWVSRRKKPVENQVHHPFQSTPPEAFRYGFTDQIQNTRAQIDALMAQCTALQMQSWKSAQVANTLQQCCVQYPPYYYGGCCGNYIG